MVVVKVGWSGGKDSTCAMYKRLENGDAVKAVCYIPYFTKDIPLINKAHHEFILWQADIFRAQGGRYILLKVLLFGITAFRYAKVARM